MRYIAVPRRPRADWSDEFYPLIEGKTVYEPDPVDTGLLDKDGNAIYRMPSPIGFVPVKER